MTTHGFSIFKVDLKDGRKKGSVSLASPSQVVDGETALDDIVNALQSWDDSIYYGRFSIPRDLDAFEATKIMRPDLASEKAIRFKEVIAHSSGRIDFQVEYGTPGSHEFAMASDAASNVPLDDKAPGNLYRASFIPARDRSTGFLLGQVRGRTVPAMNALRMSSIGMRRDLLQSGVGDPARYWEFESYRVPFIGRMPEIVRMGQIEKIELVKYGVASSGKRRRPKEVVVTQKGIKPGSLSQAIELMLSWLSSDEAELNDTGARRKEVELANNMIEVDVAPEDYDEVGFVVKGPDNKTHTVAPSSIVDVYIFPTEGEVAVSSYDDLIEQAQPHIKDLAESLSIELE